jgi:hypothetical protein
MTFGMGQNCGDCRYWSEMIARANGRGLEALCLASNGPHAQKYVPKHNRCDGWKSGHHGAVDAPPNYGEFTRAAYEAEDAR